MKTRVIICYGSEARSGKTTYIDNNKSEHDLTAAVINHELKLDTSFIEATCDAFHDTNNRYCPYYKHKRYLRGIFHLSKHAAKPSFVRCLNTPQARLTQADPRD